MGYLSFENISIIIQEPCQRYNIKIEKSHPDADGTGYFLVAKIIFLLAIFHCRGYNTK